MKLPIHGFVLAGGRSSRMGRDKALMPFCGRPMVEIAMATLAEICEHISIAGNRDDLSAFGPVVHEDRREQGPVAGIEAGMLACRSTWALFMPVDLPLLPASFVRAWALTALARAGTRASYLAIGSHPHPALCLLHKECAGEVTRSVEAGERRLQAVLRALDGLWVADAAQFADPAAVEQWFMNVNSPEELGLAEAAYERSLPSAASNAITPSSE